MTLNTHALVDAFAAREKATDELRALTVRGIRSDADRQREAALLDAIARHDGALREEVKVGARLEEQKAAGIAFRSIVDHAERSRDQIRLFGRKLSELRTLDFVDAEDSRPVDLILSAGGRGSRMLDKLTSFIFDKTSGYIPVKPAVTAFVQPRNVAQTAAEAPMRSILVRSVKVSAIVSASNESLADVPAQDPAIRDALAAAVGQRVDHAIFNGANDGDHTLTGLLADGTSATYGSTDVELADALIDAVAAVENAGGMATGVFVNPTTSARIKKLRDANGARIRLDDLPPITVLPALADGTAVIPDDTVVVLDAGSVAVGVRRSFEVAADDMGPDAYNTDRTFLAGRARVAGVHVANAARVQVLTKAVA